MNDVTTEPTVSGGFGGALLKQWNRLRRFVRGRERLFFSVWGAVIVAGFVYMWIAPAQYEASVSVASTAQENATASSSLFAGLAAAAGIGDAEQGELVSPFMQFTNTFNSKDLAHRLNAKYAMNTRIFASKWDADQKKWHMNSGLLGPVRFIYYVLSARDPWQPPGDDDLASYIAENVSLSKVGLTGMYQITYDDTNPAFAGFFLKTVTSELDEIVREQETERVDRYVAYLSKSIKAEQNSEIRDSLTEILVRQEQEKMVADSGLPYAARMLSAVWVTSRPVSPTIKMVLPLAIMIGFAVAWFTLLVSERFPRLRFRTLRQAKSTI